MAYPPATPPLNKEETIEFMERLERFTLTERHRLLYKDAEELYLQVSGK